MADDQYTRTPETAEAKRERQEAAARDGAEAMAEYQAELIAVRERTAKLRALRLAREAAEAGKGASKDKPAVKPAKRAAQAAKPSAEPARSAARKPRRKTASR